MSTKEGNSEGSIEVPKGQNSDRVERVEGQKDGRSTGRKNGRNAGRQAGRQEGRQA
jgi:hypothetical protein